MIKEYVKKPIKIEAVKLEKTFASFQECYLFMEKYTHQTCDKGRDAWYDFMNGELDGEGIIINTLEGDMLASWGDYIIKGIDGEFYPCKPEIFHKTYEEIK